MKHKLFKVDLYIIIMVEVKRFVLSFILFIFLINFIVAVDYPKIQPYVNDFANVLSPDQELQLNLLADSIEKNTSWEVAIVTVSNTNGQDRLEYAGKLGDYNGVGKKDSDNGIVVLYSLSNDQGGAIATGRGSEGIFNDAKVGTIGRSAKPLFDEGKYSEGFTKILNDIDREIHTYNDRKNSSSPVIISNQSIDSIDGFSFFVFISLLFAGFIIFRAIVDSSDDDSYSGGSSVFYASSGSSGSSSSSSSSSFSGGSFGGGSFGGGGGKF